MSDYKKQAACGGRITYTVYPPNCLANQTDKFLCEVRDGGFIADWKTFETEKLAEDWGYNHSGETSKRASDVISAMAHRWANK